MSLNGMDNEEAADTLSVRVWYGSHAVKPVAASAADSARQAVLIETPKAWEGEKAPAKLQSGRKSVGGSSRRKPGKSEPG
jgi:hypothetical protein